MGIFGKSVEENKNDIVDEVQQYLIEGEIVEEVRGMKNAFNCITNKRLIFASQVPLFKDLGVLSIPFSKIESVVIERKPAVVTLTKIIIHTRSNEYGLVFYDLESLMIFYKKLIARIV
ncbi:PH domain-containing protein [Anaerosolibacter sp.]|uniref:PH domain-containing protein n=1 Tax=Anaerosolibacter sp. TaxID=1872527 RepID=UPI0039F09A2E